MASRLSGSPVMVGNSGSAGAPRRSASQAWRTRWWWWGTSGVRRSLRPLPRVCTLAPAPRVMSSQVRRGQFGDPQPGLDGEGEHGVVAPPGPGGLVAGGEQRVDLVVGEVGDQVAFGPLGRDGQHALDRGGVFGMAAARGSRTASGSRRGGCCGCGRCCAGRVRGGPGTRRSAGRRGRRCPACSASCRCASAAKPSSSRKVTR